MIVTRRDFLKTKKKFEREQAIAFNELHNDQGISLRQIAIFYGTSHGTIKNNLEKYGFKWRSRQYPLNESFFNKLDTVEKQYFLGWLYSDGCIFAFEEKKHYGFFIKIQERDKYILEYFKQLLCSDINIQTEFLKERRYSKLVIGSKKIYEDLLMYGLMPRKTHLLTYPEQHITDHRAFILGLFDGDGFIYIRKNKMASFGITGTKEMMTKVNNIIANELNLPPPKLMKQRNSYSFTYTGTRNVHKIGEWLYSGNTTMFLKRKHELFKGISTTPKYGKVFVIFKCPHCNKKGEFEKRNIYMLKKYTFKSKFCSLSCSGSFYRKFQLHNYKLTSEMEMALKENIVGCITRYKLTDFNGSFTDYNQ